MAKEKKVEINTGTKVEPTPEKIVDQTVIIPNPPAETINVSKSEWDSMQEQIKTLMAVADKGRLFNYEAGKTQKKPLKVKLSLFNDQIITGWRTLKDDLIKHPTTGKTVGEVQEYEITLLGKNAAGQYAVENKAVLNSFQAFSDARYTERIEVEVVGKKEDMNGKFTYDIQLPEGSLIQLEERFLN
jgi:hypothetical protein